MKNKKKLIGNAIIQFEIIFIIISLFFFEKLDLIKINFLFNTESFQILILLIISKLFISIFFCLILQILFKKRRLYKIIKIYMLGGLANEAIPGLGYIYRYHRFKNELKISIIEYGSSQSINNIFILFSYLLIAVSFISFEVKLDSTLNLFFIITIILLLIFFLVYRYRFNLIYFVKLQRVYNDLS